MRTLPIFMLLLCLYWSCQPSSTPQDQTASQESSPPKIASTVEENYNIKGDSLFFNSGTIENFDTAGNSIDVYWIGEEKDTILRFYRKYDANQQPIGAEYFEPGDTEPNKDSIYFNEKGQKVEASLNAENQISWKSTFTTDERGNPVLKSYENGKGEYRGFDSLYFDDQNRVVKGFYENSKGKRYSIRTYTYTQSDDYGNWTERQLFKDDSLSQKQTRMVTYHN